MQKTFSSLLRKYTAHLLKEFGLSIECSALPSAMNFISSFKPTWHHYKSIEMIDQCRIEPSCVIALCEETS